MKKVILCCLLLLPFTSHLKAEDTETVNFYDEQGQLIVSYELPVGSYFEVPSIKKDGYNFIGFNTQANGNGEYLITYKVWESKNYYAIYEIINYNVEYYVQGKLFYKTTVPYQNNAPNIIAPEVDGLEFTGWSGLSNIQCDTQINASFQEKINVVEVEEKPSIQETTEMKLVNADEDSELIDEVVVDNKNYIEKENMIMNKVVNKNTNYAPYVFLFIAVFFISLKIIKKTTEQSR